MAGHAAIPDGVDPESAALLRRAYDLKDVAEGQQLYREWAESYDATMLDGLGYTAPRLLVELFAHAAPARFGPILDLACGTGLVGAELAQRGFAPIDGVDLSRTMMDVAARLGIYRSLIEAELTAVLPLEDGAYAAAICNGTFTSGHVGASCIDEIVRVIAPGGLLACAVHHSVWENLGFADAFSQRTTSGSLRVVEIRESPFYETSTNDGRLCVFAVEPCPS
jgi:predicted TPR repeat methyltransferase